MRYIFLLTFALLLPTVCLQAAPPKPDFADLPAYLRALNASTDPEAQAIRRRIAAGPVDLARERIAAEKEGIPTRPDQLPPSDQNAAPLYVQLDALRKQKPLHFPMYAQSLSGRYAYTPEQIAVVQKEYDTRQDVFTLLHQAADKPQCAFAHDYSKGFNGDSFRNYAGLRESAREINTESLLLAYKGDYPGAVSNQQRGFRIADHAASEPLVINFLVGAAIEAITLDGMQTILDRAGPNAYLDNCVVADLSLLRSQPDGLSLRHNLSGEAAVADANFILFRHAKPAEIAQSFPSDSPFSTEPSDSASAGFDPIEQREWSLFVDASEASYLHRICRAADAFGLSRSSRQTIFRQIDAEAQENKDDPITAFSSLLLPSLEPIGEALDRVTAQREVTAAGAAILAVKAQTGVFPDTLRSQFINPFTGKPLGYRREGTDGFVFYSAGPSGTDDGGKPGDARKMQVWFRYPLVTVPIPPDMLK